MYLFFGEFFIDFFFSIVIAGDFNHIIIVVEKIIGINKKTGFNHCSFLLGVKTTLFFFSFRKLFFKVIPFIYMQKGWQFCIVNLRYFD